jgi:pyruvate/2-oxoacid:ferredoxin oxidoreductase beta subunit
MEGGEVTSVHKIGKRVPVEDYLIAQARFKHLTGSAKGKKEVAKIRRIADYNIERLGLLENGRKGG